MDGDQSVRQAQDGEEMRRLPIITQLECASCGAAAPCPVCPERQQVMRTLWRRWLLFLILLIADLGLAWSLRHFSLW